MHPVAGGNVAASEYVPGVTEIAGHRTNAFQIPVPKHETKYKTFIRLIKYMNKI